MGSNAWVLTGPAFVGHSIVQLLVSLDCLDAMMAERLGIPVEIVAARHSRKATVARLRRNHLARLDAAVATGNVPAKRARTVILKMLGPAQQSLFDREDPPDDADGE